MATMSIEELYEQYIKPLSPAEQMRLIAMTAQDLAQTGERSAAKPKRSIMELHGLGAALWKGVDAQDYVNALRDEWDQQP